MAIDEVIAKLGEIGGRASDDDKTRLAQLQNRVREITANKPSFPTQLLTLVDAVGLPDWLREFAFRLKNRRPDGQPRTPTSWAGAASTYPNIQVDSDNDDLLVETGPGQLTFNLVMNDLTGMKLQRVSRALLKMALECAYIDHGYWNVISPKWNRLCEAVFDNAHRGYVVLPEQVTPDGGPLQMSYMPSDHELPSAHILGLGHVLAFPEPKKTPTLTLTLGVTYGGKRSVRLDSDETPPFASS